METASASDYRGSVTATSLSDGRLRIDEAPPRIRISDTLMDALRAGPHHPDVSLDGDVLRIDAVNRQVAYRITGRDNAAFCHLAEMIGRASGPPDHRPGEAQPLNSSSSTG